jgi:hypothetical protein
MEYCHKSDGLSATKVVARTVVIKRVLGRSKRKVLPVTMLALEALMATRVKLVGKLSRSPMAMSAG